jgi:8-oxo-dGTP diphosphatase
MGSPEHPNSPSNGLRESPELIAWPRAAASAAIFRDRRILIAERGSGPRKGYWSLPGGKIEPGETAMAAAVREIHEETSLDVTISGLLDVHNVIGVGGDGLLTHHYIICVYYGMCGPGEPRAATDISDARFVTLEDLPRYQLTDGALPIIREAHRRLGLAD